jgi:hypothetical protein
VVSEVEVVDVDVDVDQTSPVQPWVALFQGTTQLWRSDLVVTQCDDEQESCDNLNPQIFQVGSVVADSVKVQAARRGGHADSWWDSYHGSIRYCTWQ